MNVTDYKQLENWPFKLGATFRLVAKRLLDGGWSIRLIDQDKASKQSYFLAQKHSTAQLIASVRHQFYSSLNARTAYFITTNKASSSKLASELGVKVPKELVVGHNQPIPKEISTWSGVVIKPVQGMGGKGVTVNPKGLHAITKAINAARRISHTIILQEFLHGHDYRLLFLDYNLFAAVRRDPATVVGDGMHTIKELIESKNNLPKDENSPGTLSPIQLDEAERVLGTSLLNSVPKQGEEVKVSDKANLTQGGVAVDVTDKVNPAYQDLLSPLARILGLKICGFDILTTDISVSPNQTNAALIEINAAPSIRLHTHPYQGQPRDAAAKIVAMLEKQA